jgi:4-hydroxy-4-methyl-2-oxoglutarate aldolase
MRLFQVGSSTVHEAAGPFGRRGAMDAGIKRSYPDARVCGRAFTVQCHPADNLGIHEAVVAAHRGEVLVVDAGGVLAGYWGELLTAVAQAKGVAGLIIDGGVRDIDQIAVRGFPVFARGVSMLGTTKCVGGTLGAVVVCGGVPVRPGDWVLGDGDGVVVVAAPAVGSVLKAAEQRKKDEADLLIDIDRGVAPEHILLRGVKPRVTQRN